MKTKMLILCTLFSVAPLLPMEPAQLSPATRQLFDCFKNRNHPLDLEEVKNLLDRGADVNARSCDIDYLTPLYWAAWLGNLDLCKLLINRGAQVDRVTGYRQTPLFAAVAKGHKDICMFLIRMGASVNSVDWVWKTPLNCAAAHNHLELCKLLMNYNPNLNPLCSPLYSAAYAGNLEICKLLIEKRYEIDVTSDKYRSPLAAAALKGHLEVCTLLIDNGADVNLCPGIDNPDTAKARVKVDPDTVLNLEDWKSKTPLFFAVQNGDPKVCKLLAVKGATLHARDVHYYTPLDYAAKRGRLSVCHTLLEYACIPPEYPKEEAQKIRTTIVLVLWALKHAAPCLNKDLQLMIVVRALNDDLLKALLPIGSYSLPPYCIPFITKHLTKSTISALKPLMNEARTVAKTEEIQALLAPDTLEERMGEKIYANILVRLQALNKGKKEAH